jgi:DNA processing protein
MEQREYTPDELLGTLNDVERKNAPEKLYTAGDASLIRWRPRVSVVGSRKASPEGIRRARAFAEALVRHDTTVVSGLAEGIDTVAHETAIAKGGRTIAVLGTPLNQVFPAKNRALQDRIMQEHLALSQFPAGYPPSRKTFPIRNRTMALISDATVIVEAGEKSGTLHQGWEALRLGRLLFLMESVAINSALSWPEEMIRYGAQVLARDNLEAVLNHLAELSVDQAVSI